MFFLSVKTEKNWVKSAAETPLFGSLFVFILIFIVPVICSFILHAIIPALHDESGFTKAMFVLLPSWNFLMWILKIRLFLLFIPAWIILGIIAIIKAITNDY